MSTATACGDDCSFCPRYTSKTEEELRRTAEMWYEMGFRDSIVSNEEIACTGCSRDNKCTYHITECTENKLINNCGECSEYPCETVNQMFERTQKYEAICKERCSKEDFDRLKKAFFSKKEILDAIKKKLP